MDTQGKAVTDKTTIMMENYLHGDWLRIIEYTYHLLTVRVNIYCMEIWGMVFGCWVGDVSFVCNFAVLPSTPEQGWDSVLNGPTVSFQITIYSLSNFCRVFYVNENSSLIKLMSD